MPPRSPRKNSPYRLCFFLYIDGKTDGGGGRYIELPGNWTGSRLSVLWGPSQHRLCTLYIYAMFIKESSWPLLECWKVKRPTRKPPSLLPPHRYCYDYEIVITIWCRDSSSSPHPFSLIRRFFWIGRGVRGGSDTKRGISFQWCAPIPSDLLSFHTPELCNADEAQNNWISILKRRSECRTMDSSLIQYAFIQGRLDMAGGFKCPAEAVVVKAADNTAILSVKYFWLALRMKPIGRMANPPFRTETAAVG